MSVFASCVLIREISSALGTLICISALLISCSLFEVTHVYMNKIEWRLHDIAQGGPPDVDHGGTCLHSEHWYSHLLFPLKAGVQLEDRDRELSICGVVLSSY